MSPESRVIEREQPELNLLSILAQVKAQVDKQMQDEKVELYKDLLLGGNNENTQLMQELQLPYMFRGQALLAADNCLIFDDFYG